MSRITTHPAPPARPQSPDTSPLFFRLHLLLTAVLVAAVASIGVMAAVGVVTFGKPAKETKDGKSATTPDGSEEKGGRYQIEVADDARAAMGLGMSGLEVPVREAFVFHFKGGFVECKLEDDSGKPPLSPPEVPRKDAWHGLFSDDPEVAKGNPDALNKEGFIVLLAMAPSLDDILDPLHPHLGAMFTTGPAGALHSLVPFYHEVWRRYDYRLFLSVRPPKGKAGPGFDYPSRHALLVRTHLANDDPKPYAEPAETAGGKDLEAGKEVTLLKRKRGLGAIRLKARFLSDAEAVEKAKPKPEKLTSPDKE